MTTALELQDAGELLESHGYPVTGIEQLRECTCGWHVVTLRHKKQGLFIIEVEPYRMAKRRWNADCPEHGILRKPPIAAP
jgi:hypothetical protein